MLPLPQLSSTFAAGRLDGSLVRTSSNCSLLLSLTHSASFPTGVILPVDAGTTAGNPNRPALKEDSLASASNGQPTVATG